MGVDPWVDRGHVPLLFEVEGTPCVLTEFCFPLLFGGRHFSTLINTGMTIRYDTIGEFNVDSKSEYSALNVARKRN